MMAVYVVSDIHGLYDRYEKIYETIDFKPQDTLYVLGDVIDRGPRGIDILLDIKKRENVFMMMGNHEHMMMEYYQAKRKKKRLLNEVDMKALERWHRNGCDPTIQAFEKLPIWIQEELLDDIAHLPLAFPNLIVNKHRYYLVHAQPVPTQAYLIDLALCEKDNIDPNHLIWDRFDVDQSFFHDKCVICGHTVTMYLQDAQPFQLWYRGSDLTHADIIDIDCGCACNDESSRLCVLRLDDHKVWYIS